MSPDLAESCLMRGAVPLEYAEQMGGLEHEQKLKGVIATLLEMM